MALNSMEVQKLTAIFGRGLADRLVDLLNLLDVTAGTSTPSKAVILDGDSRFNEIILGNGSQYFSIDTGDALGMYAVGLPSSASGLGVGQVWSNSGALTVVTG